MEEVSAPILRNRHDQQFKSTTEQQQHKQEEVLEKLKFSRSRVRLRCNKLMIINLSSPSQCLLADLKKRIL